MSGNLVVPIIIALALVVVIVLVVRSRNANDGVDSFRRQIDALSPEARRPVVDQVQNAAGRQASDEADDDDDDGDDEDGVRGT